MTDASSFLAYTRKKLQWSGHLESGWGCLELKGSPSKCILRMHPTRERTQYTTGDLFIQEGDYSRSYTSKRILTWPIQQGALSKVVVSGIPRSGTSWLHRIILRLCSWVGLTSEKRLFMGKRLDDFPLNDVEDLEYQRLDRFLHSEESFDLVCLKTHFIAQLGAAQPGTKWVYIYRDPRDVICSAVYWYLYGPMKGSAHRNPESSLREHVEWLFPRMRQSFLDALSSAPDECLIVRYAHLHRSAPTEILRMSAHLGIELSKEMATCIANRHSFRRESGRPRRISLKEEYHRKGVVGGWEEDLMPSVREETLRFYDTVCPLLEPLYERSVLSYVNTNSLGG